MRHFSLESYFAKVYGSELSGERVDKGELIAHLLETEGLDRGAWMIGDREHDIRGAKANGLV